METHINPTPPIVALEGLFSTENGALYVVSEAGIRQCVADVLAPMIGMQVRFAAHYIPDMTQGGKPPCFWPQGACPTGHARNPRFLYAVSDEGLLSSPTYGEYAVHTFDGSSVHLPLGTVMPNHYGRVLCASLVYVDRIRDALAQSKLGDMVQAITPTDISGESDV